MKQLIKINILSLLLLIWTNGILAANPAALIAIKSSASSYKTEIEFQISHAVKERVFTMTHPDRLVVDLMGVKPKHVPVLKIHPKPDWLKTTRIGYPRPDQVRYVMELAQRIHWQANRLPGGKGDRDRMVLVVTPTATQTIPPSKSAKSSVSSKPMIAHQPLLAENDQVSASSNLRDVVIVIDPGHGGKDPGATGPNGYHEKDVVLAISKYLQQLINQQRGFKAYLTRSGDYYLTLRQRLAIARKYNADMFVAIHADAAPRNQQARGATVFALSERGATSEAARWLAERENQSELGGVNLTDKSYTLKSVLIDLSQTATITSSLAIGQSVMYQLARITPLHHTRVEQAAFVVLKSPDIPSLLVESGYITNPREERQLINSRYQMQLAQAMMQGITSYFVRRPPQGTWLAYQDKKAMRVG